MTICLISPFFYPEPISTGKYNTFLAEKLIQNGERVTVFCSHPVYPDWKVSESTEKIEGVTIIRGGASVRYPKSAILRRAILEIWFATFIFKNLIFNKTRHEKYILIFPPSLFALLFSIIKKRNKKIYGIVHDLQGVYAQKSKSISGLFLQKAIAYIEKRSFANCEKLIFLSDSMLERAVTEYKLDRTNCFVNYPFVALPDTTESKDSLPEETISEKNFNFVYSGALGEKQNPIGLINLMIECSKILEDVEFHIFSAGPHFQEIKELGKHTRVRFHSLVKADQLIELYKRSNIQIIPQADHTADGSLPSKLPNLIASNTAIFSICEKNTELDKLLRNIEDASVSNTWEESKLIEETINFIKVIKSKSRNEIGPQRLKTLKKFSVNDLLEKIQHG